MADSAKQYLVIDKDGKGHLPVCDSPDGPLNHRLMGAAWAALHGGHRGNKYEGPGKQEAISKLKALYKSEGMDLPSEQSLESGVRSPESTIGPSDHLAIGSSADDSVTRSPDHPIVNVLSRRLRLTLAAPQLIGGKELYSHPIAVTGSWAKNGHKFSITPEDLRTIVRNFEKRKNDMVVVDFEHASEMPEVARGGPVPAAGWIHSLVIGDLAIERLKITQSPDHPIVNSPLSAITQSPDHPILNALIEWTPQAVEMIRSGQYRFFSPAIDFNADDKETGKPQGATLTSGALTNHPFLEELPAITLSDHELVAGSQLPVASEGEVVTGNRQLATGYFSQGGTMKEFSLKKLEEGEHAGHHGVFDGDECAGYIPHEQFEGYATQHLAGFEGRCHNEKLRELLAAVGADPPASGGRRPEEEVQRLIELGRETEQDHTRAASRALLLAQCLRSGPGTPPLSPLLGEQGKREARGGGGPLLDGGKAKVLLRAGKISTEDFIDAHETAEFIERAVQEGRVLPKDCEKVFKIALTNADYREYLKTAPRVVLLGSIGLGTGTGASVDDEVSARVREAQEKNPKLTYGEAFTQVLASDTTLAQRYHQAHRREVGSGAQSAVA